MKSRRHEKYKRTTSPDDGMVKRLDALAQFEEFEDTILPKLRAAIKAGKKAEDIYDMVTAAAAGKIATLAITEKDSAKALALCKEILDRSGGKARERVDITSRYEKMTDEELDRQLLAQEEQLYENDASH